MSARFVYHDYTPDFVRQQITATLARPITYTLADGSHRLAHQRRRLLPG